MLFNNFVIAIIFTFITLITVFSFTTTTNSDMYDSFAGGGCHPLPSSASCSNSNTLGSNNMRLQPLQDEKIRCPTNTNARNADMTQFDMRKLMEYNYLAALMWGGYKGLQY